jgi:O-antigen/teichoic acid export membrane protein
MLGILLAFSIAAAGYLLPLAVARHWIVRKLYGSGYYEGFAWLLVYLCAGSLIGSMIQGLSIWLKAIERPNAVFWSQAAGAVVTVTIGVFLLWKFKLSGAALALILDKIGMILVLACFLGRYSRNRQ